jgi:murein L,D-transpeptidase YafK
MINPTSRAEQMTYARVRLAYAEKEHIVEQALADISVSMNSLRIYLRAFKSEKKLELWARNNTDLKFKLVKTFDICHVSGTMGPKRRYLDFQVPEGYYHIASLNPFSRFHLSLEVNYPNQSDKIRGEQGNLGNEIYIHGSCASMGCIAMTDDKIKEIYVYCVEALNSGQEEIALTIFPAHLNSTNYPVLISRYTDDLDKISLWSDLKTGYDSFNLTKSEPRVRFLGDGRHWVN